MKVLVSDNLGEVGIQMFKEAPGIEVDVKTGLKPEELKAIIGEYDALAIRSNTKVTEEIFSAATRLKVVARAGIGLDNVDIPAATKRGILLMMPRYLWVLRKRARKVLRAREQARKGTPSPRA